MNIAVLENCDDSHNFDMSNDHLSITGVGLSMPPKAQQHATKCAIQTTLTIDPNTPPGLVAILVLDEHENPVGFTDFTVMDSASAAIRPGLPPNVDDILGVMAQNNCSDAFGNNMAGTAAEALMHASLREANIADIREARRAATEALKLEPTARDVQIEAALVFAISGASPEVCGAAFGAVMLPCPLGLPWKAGLKGATMGRNFRCAEGCNAGPRFSSESLR